MIRPAYFRAADLWIRGDPEISWDELVTWFFHHGVVLSLPAAFILARPHHSARPPAEHLSLSPLQSGIIPDCWNIWLACGSLRHFATMHTLRPLPYLSYCRRGRPETFRIVRTNQILP
jgi:hypothetical protein